MQANGVDLIIITILLLSAISGFRQGIIVSLGRMTSAIFAIGLAVFYRNEFLTLLDNKFAVTSNFAELIRQKVPVLAAVENATFLSFIVGQGGIVEPAEKLAHFILVPIAFIVLLLMGNFLFSLFSLLLNRLVSWGGIGGINRSLGMFIVILQNLVIITVILGIAMPPLEFAARLDIMGVSAVNVYLQDSLLVNYLAGIFEYLKNICGKYA